MGLAIFALWLPYNDTIFPKLPLTRCKGGALKGSNAHFIAVHSLIIVFLSYVIIILCYNYLNSLLIHSIQIKGSSTNKTILH